MKCITSSQYICNKSDKQELVHVVQGANAGVGGRGGGRKERKKDGRVKHLLWYEVFMLCMQEIPLIRKCIKRRNVYVNNLWKFWYLSILAPKARKHVKQGCLKWVSQYHFCDSCFTQLLPEL